MAPSASSAATTPKPSTARKSVSNPTISGSSSTSRTVGVLTPASVAQPPRPRGGFPRIFIASSRRAHGRLVHCEAQRTRREHEQVHHDPGRRRHLSCGGDRGGRAARRRGGLEDAAQAGEARRRLRRVRRVPAQPWARRRARGPDRAQAVAGRTGRLRFRHRRGRPEGLQQDAARQARGREGARHEGPRRLRARPRPRRADRARRVQALGGRQGGQRPRRAGRRHPRLQDGAGPRASKGPGKPGACVNDARPADDAAKEQDAAKQPDAANEQGT